MNLTAFIGTNAKSTAQPQKAKIVGIFNWENLPLRIAKIDGEAWILAADACDLLKIKNVSQAVNGNIKAGSKGLDEKDKGILELDTPGGKQKALFVSKSGFRRLVFKSKTPDALEIQDFVFDTVLPSLEETGSYTMPGAAAPAVAKKPARKGPTTEDRLRRWATWFEYCRKSTVAQLAELSQQVAELKETQAKADTILALLESAPPQAPQKDLAHLGQNSRMQAIIHHIRTHYNRGAASPHLAAIARNCRCTRADAQTAIALFDLENAVKVQ